MTPPPPPVRRSRWVVPLLAAIAATLLVGVGLFGFATYQTYRAGRAVSETYHEKKAALKGYAASAVKAAPAEAVVPAVERLKEKAEQVRDSSTDVREKARAYADLAKEAAADPRVQALKATGKERAKEKLSAWFKKH